MKLVCASGCSLGDAAATGLRCELNGDLSLDGEYADGAITCCKPEGADLPLDTEAGSGVPCKVFCKDALIHEGSAVALVASGGGAAPRPSRAPSRRPSLRDRYGALYPFAIISISYLLFTITDGAVRMIVLLHAYQQAFSAMDVAIMFSFYEAAGVFTNLAAGLLGARWGIKTTLLAGLAVQLAGLGMLFGWQEDWSKAAAIVYVTASQTLCGVAKDLVKLGGKTVTKLVTPEGRDSRLFKLVSFLTGWKNSLKGAGYFLGAATVGVNYFMSLGILCGLVVAAVPVAAFGLTNQLGRARKDNVRLSQLLRSPRNVNVLSFSRIFLFGSRDLWFEVPLPFFLRSPASGIGWSRAATGAFLAVFIIVYGQVQSWTPQAVLAPLRQSPPDKYGAAWWAASLAVPVAILGGIMVGSDVFGPGADAGGAVAAITTLLYTFCILFAVNSAIHSYLIVRYSEGDKVAMQVGVYYASNAMGRFTGTLLSGVLYTYASDSVVTAFGVCLFASMAFSVVSAGIDAWLTEDAPGSWWAGPFNRCMPFSARSKAALAEREVARAAERAADKKDKKELEEKVEAAAAASAAAGGT